MRKIQGGGSVGIVLVFHRFGGLRFDKELPCEPDPLLVVDDHMQEPGHLFLFVLQVGVQKRLVPFAAAPEHVVLAAQSLRGVEARA